MVEIDSGSDPVEIPEAQVRAAFERVRTFTLSEGSIFCITEVEDAGADLVAIGGHPSMPYSYFSAYHPNHEASAGFKCEREWRGFPRAFTEIAREVANRQYAERIARGQCFGRGQSEGAIAA